MGELIQISKHRRRKQTPEQIDDFPEDIRDKELGENVIRLVRKIDEEVPDEPA